MFLSFLEIGIELGFFCVHHSALPHEKRGEDRWGEVCSLSKQCYIRSEHIFFPLLPHPHKLLLVVLKYIKMEYWITYLGGHSLSVICMPAHQSPAIHWFFFLLLFFSFLPFLFRAAMAIGNVISIIAKFLQRALSPIQSLQLKLLKNFEKKKRKKKKKRKGG